MPGKIHFGVYELDRDAMELRKHGVPIRLQDQPLRVLAALLERPGEIVTREELREQIWAKDTFVDFDQSVNKAVNRVREALNDDAGHPQYVETIPRRGYRFVAPVTGITPPGQHGAMAASSALPDSKSGESRDHSLWFWRIAALAGVFVLLGIAAVVRSRKGEKPKQQREAMRMSTSGFAPALSRDGKLLAYVSSGDSNVLHIWVKQTARGEAVPVTSGPDPDFEADFSPDGTRISFRSAREGGGIYIAPTLHGEPRLVVRSPGAFFPRFSPKGDRILYLADQKVFTVPLDGGTPVALAFSEDFEVLARPPLWSPSGNEILFYGAKKSEPEKPGHWWIAPLTGGQPRLVLLPGVGEDNELFFGPVRAWARTKDGREWIVYSASTRDTWKLLRIETSAFNKVDAKPEQLASGTGQLAFGGALSEDGMLAYAAMTFSESIYEVPINERGQKLGPTFQLAFSEEGHFRSPSVSRDGRWMEYQYSAFNPDGPKTVMLRDLHTGIDRFIDDKGPRPFGGATSISPDGAKVIFERECKEGKWPTRDAMPCSFMAPASGEAPEQICEFCTARGFSSNGSIVLIQKYAMPERGQDRIATIDLATKTGKDFLSLPDRGLYHAFFSWDDRWVVFKKPLESNKAQILIASARHGAAGKEAEWVAVTDGLHWDDKPQFSPDGNTVYFTSTRDGYLCIWAQKLDPATKRPVDAPVAYEHFHNEAGRDAVVLPDFGWDLTVARDKMLINLPRKTSGIWTVQVD